MKQIIGAVSVIFIVVGLITILFTLNSVRQEEERLQNDIQYRSYLLSNSLKESVEPNFISKSDAYLQSVVERFVDQQRIAGLAVVDNTGAITAVSSSLPKELPDVQMIATENMDADLADGKFTNFADKKMYVYASPLHDQNKSVVGALIVVQNAGYIDNRLLEIWKNNFLRLSVQSLLVSFVVLLILRWIIYIPIRKLVEAMQLTRKGANNKSSYRAFDNPIFGPLLQEVSNMQLNLIEARVAASEEARLRLQKLDSPWTAERLKAFVRDILKKREIFIVSNREPYIHTKNGGNKITYHFPASGMVTALEPIMQATGGMWIAHGSGNADKLVVDHEDKIAAPPDEPRYTLKRVWLTKEEEEGYYLGFSNEGLWPLCHIAHTRPVFREEDWHMYQKVNEKFAKSVLKEIKNKKDPIILIQDFHFALLPKLIKAKRPDATIGIFWHIPWPNPESFSVCPWRKELIEGMLGADIIGFHTQLHCNNFITTVGRELEAQIDLEQFAVIKNHHFSYVKPFPISIAFTKTDIPEKNVKAEVENSTRLLEKLNIKSKYIGVGIDRLDYTKGILERLKGIEIFLTKHPSYIEEFSFIQLSAPSRSSIKEYQEFDERVEKEVDRINNLFKKNGWKPIIFLKEHHNHEYINSLYRSAHFCLVSSLHDGMNLVAKEFIAARDDEQGVLILSQFAGASRELHDALIINPYNGEDTAKAIEEALLMKPEEQKRRMHRMREIIKNYNVYRWSAELLRAIIDLG
ncbi:MAG TPA: trehalose-6-phosphate synthase [Patescibacteria group bacterium]|nr:trehalose-6-phosphate synthase [Patescibacteria group bacterium]